MSADVSPKRSTGLCPRMFCFVLLLICLFQQVDVLAAIKLMWTCYTNPHIHKGQLKHWPGISYPTLLEYCSLTSHIELMNMEGICETGPTVYIPYPRRLKFNHLQLLLQSQLFLLSYFKTLSVGPSGVELTTSCNVFDCRPIHVTSGKVLRSPFSDKAMD